ncbi:hypothetical protein OPIT5_00035 (plasmid) [Opitutaceae bacterium TAV5]|nr:hypothetical protein OPIT5_00035 [Opitutaceae bacterium TAV5]
MPDSQKPDLPVTPRKESKSGDRAQSTFHVHRRWFAEYRLKAFLIAVAILVPLVSLKWTKDAIAESKRATWVWNTDSNGVLVFAPAELADPDSRIFREIGIQAAEVYLKRNPAGLSNPELLTRYYTAEAQKAVRLELRSQEDERNRRNLYDQPEFTRMPERLDDSGGALRYRIQGFIVRSGVIDGLPQRDVGDFRLSIELTPTVAVMDKGRFPYQINRYKKTVVWRSNKRSEEFTSALK